MPDTYTILIVEDDPGFTSYLKRLLRRKHLRLIPEFCTQIAFNEVRGQVAAIDLGDDCYLKIQVSIFPKYFQA